MISGVCLGENCGGKYGATRDTCRHMDAFGHAIEELSSTSTDKMSFCPLVEHDEGEKIEDRDNRIDTYRVAHAEMRKIQCS